MAAGGVLVAACVLVADLVIFVRLAAAGFMPAGRDLMGYVVYGGLSLVLLAVALGAHRRARRGTLETVAPLLTRLVPWLAGAGVAAGIGLGIVFARDSVESEQRRSQHLCELVLRPDAPSTELAACLSRATACRRIAAAEDARLGDQPWSHDTSSPIRTRAMQLGVECLQRESAAPH